MPPVRIRHDQKQHSMSSPKPSITIYCMPGSQFSGKVLAALDTRKIDHCCVFVPIPLDQRRKVIPSGGTMVPEMKVVWNDRPEEEPVVVSDSEAILHWLDDHLDTEFFPATSNNLASELSLRASTNQLAGFVWYFNWVDEQGYHQSMRRSMAKAMAPSWLPSFLALPLVDLFVASTKTNYFPARTSSAF